MSGQRGSLSFIVILSVVVGVWAPRSRGGRATHDEIAGPPAVKADAKQLKTTVVSPHLEGEIKPGQNLLWCATFQIAWNDYRDLPSNQGQPSDASEMAKVLDKRAVTRRDLDESGYVAMAGYTTGDSNDVRRRIRRELERKFAGAASPQLLSRLDTAAPGVAVAYAYLFKYLPFEWAFERLKKGLTFNGRTVESFGIRQFLKIQENEAKAAVQIVVHDHRSSDDFVLELKTRSQSDRLILAKIPPGHTLGETIATVQDRIREGKREVMHEDSDLMIPVIDFDVLREYSELCGSGAGLAMAAQQIRFKLDEKGAVLKSEAVIALSATKWNLIFNKPFLIMIQRTDAQQPYFALWVDNAELLVSSEK